jgi:hypothetical protein
MHEIHTEWLNPSGSRRDLKWKATETRRRLLLFISSKKLLDIEFVSIKDQVADGFTKPLLVRQLEMFKSNLNLMQPDNIDSSLRISL